MAASTRTASRQPSEVASHCVSGQKTVLAKPPGEREHGDRLAQVGAEDEGEAREGRLVEREPHHHAEPGPDRVEGGHARDLRTAPPAAARRRPSRPSSRAARRAGRCAGPRARRRVPETSSATRIGPDDDGRRGAEVAPHRLHHHREGVVEAPPGDDLGDAQGGDDAPPPPSRVSSASGKPAQLPQQHREHGQVERARRASAPRAWPRAARSAARSAPSTRRSSRPGRRDRARASPPRVVRARCWLARSSRSAFRASACHVVSVGSAVMRSPNQRSSRSPASAK